MDAAISTKDTPGPFDGFAKAKSGEPIFTLIGHDQFAAPLVLEWARLNREKALGIEDEAKRRAELLQSSEAEKIAWAMDEYRKGYASEPETPFQAYSGYKSDAAAQAKVDESRDRLAAARRVDNSVAELTDAAEVARRYGLEGDALAIETALVGLKAASAGIRPSR